MEVVISTCSTEVSILPTKTVVCSNENDSFAQRQDDETRGDREEVKREEDEVNLTEQRDPIVVPSSKVGVQKESPVQHTQQQTQRQKSSTNAVANTNVVPPLSHNQQHQSQQHFNSHFHPSMPGPGNRGGFPMGGRGYGALPPYGYAGGPGNYPPPPQFHHHAPHPHSMMGYHNSGPYTITGGMKSNFGPPQMPHYGSGGPHGPHYGIPNQHQYAHHAPGMNTYGGMSSMMMSSSNDSISSKSSMNSQKKRTIDGMQLQHSSMRVAVPQQFRRTDSTTSSASTVTVGNNNNNSETHLTEDSLPMLNRNNSHDDAIGALNMESMMFGNGGVPKESSANSSFHRRSFSGASTASTLSVGGFSLASYERGNDPMMVDNDTSKSSPKRHKKNTLVIDTGVRPSSALALDSEGPESSRFEQLSIDAKNLPSNSSTSSGNSNLFLSLSTSPINADMDATPNIKNTAKQEHKENTEKNSIFKKKGSLKNRPSETPTPPIHGELGESESMNDEHSTLNRHLRGQSFTPLHHLSNVGSSGASPSHAAFASAIAPQLSWSIAGDTPSLGDLAEWDDEQSGKLKADQKHRPSSTTSTETRNMTISPHDFQLWKEEHDLVDRTYSGTTTPLPVFFEQSGNEGVENQNRCDNHSLKHHGMRHHDHMSHPMNLGSMRGKQYDHVFWKHHEAMGMPPTPMFSSSDFRDDVFMGHSPMHSDRRDGMEYNYPPYSHYGQGDRIRNLRGRVPPGAHMPPMPLHIPPHMSSHLPIASPMGLGAKGGMWSPHHGMGGHLGSSPHMGSPLSNMAQSKRKCLPLKPPIPSKFQGNMEKIKLAQVPEFTSLVNFPAHMSQKQAVNLPEGMRCCVMCGHACPCSNGNRTCKKTGKPGCKNEGGLAPRNNNGQDHLGDKNSGYAIIPTQNKGLCTLCDVNVWVVSNSGLEIKWCKGCKNFRPWAAFGDKGLATKCLRCRERQREKYALQKDEKEKSRLDIKPKKE